MAKQEMDEAEVWRGEDVTLRIKVAGEDKPDDETPHYRVAVRASAEALVEVGPDDISEPDEDHYDVPLTHEQLASLRAQAHYHELYRASTRNVLAYGQLNVRESQLARHDED